MTIDKAIEILTDHVRWCDPVKEVDTYNALKLGIEAMRRYKVIRANFGKLRQDLLPSETKD